VLALEPTCRSQRPLGSCRSSSSREALLHDIRRKGSSVPGALPTGDWEHEAPLLRRLLDLRLPDRARAHAASTYVTTPRDGQAEVAGLDKPALRAICEDTRNAVRARVRLCPTACPARPQLPMVEPKRAGIIIRVSGVCVPLRHSPHGLTFGVESGMGRAGTAASPRVEKRTRI
jgi:hypothetical protein